MTAPRRRIVRLLVAAAVLAAAVPAARPQDAQKRRGFSVEVTAPSGTDFVLGRTKIEAQVKTDTPQDIDRVEFFVGDKLVFVDREAPWECYYDFGEDIKSWVIRAVAYRKDGISVSDAVVTRKVVVSYFEEVNRVILWMTVTNGDKLVTDLKKDDFKVFEDNDPQEILEFYREDRPITLALLIDTSGSMRDSMKDVHQAASGFVDALAEKDKALVIDFDDKVFLTQDLTADKAALKEAVSSTEALGGTAIYDALHAAYRKLRGIEGRKAIILLTDGEDTASQTGYDRILQEVRAEGIILYAVGLGDVRKGVLRELSETTGGRPYFVGRAQELAGVYQKIAEELRAQFYRAYQTRITKWDGRFVKLKIEGSNKDWTIRARKGFYAVKSGLAH